uniref:Uncharacterized protein n=1 Tax=Oryza glumipatula TaxID=40148 RepID=A0A0E0BJ24_9ORYZ
LLQSPHPPPPPRSPLIASSLFPLRRPCRRQPSQPCDRASPSSSLHTADERGPARPRPSTLWICPPLSSRSARLPIIIELGIEACCNCFLPICVAHDVVTRPIQLEAAAGAYLGQELDNDFEKVATSRNTEEICNDKDLKILSGSSVQHDDNDCKILLF